MLCYFCRRYTATSITTLIDRSTHALKTFRTIDNTVAIEHVYYCPECADSIRAKLAIRKAQRSIPGPDYRPFIARVLDRRAVRLQQGALL